MGIAFVSVSDASPIGVVHSYNTSGAPSDAAPC